MTKLVKTIVDTSMFDAAKLTHQSSVSHHVYLVQVQVQELSGEI